MTQQSETLHARQRADADRPDLSCRVCAHPHRDHDSIATRYCAATRSGALARRCICLGMAGASRPDHKLARLSAGRYMRACGDTTSGT